MNFIQHLCPEYQLTEKLSGYFMAGKLKYRAHKLQGLDSAILSMAGARQLGLVAYGRQGAGG